MNPFKLTPIDVWSTREKLALASSVLTAGDQNWHSVSRSLKPFGEKNRPQDWFSQKNCALQYSELLENVETPKRKRGEKNEDTVQNLIVRKLTLERVKQLNELIEGEREECEQLKRKVDQLSDEKIDDKLLDLLYEEMLKEQDQQAEEHETYQQWLREREEKYAAMMVGKQKGISSSVRAKQDLHHNTSQLVSSINTSTASSVVSTTTSTPLSASPSVATPVIASTIASTATVATESKVTSDVSTSAKVNQEANPTFEPSAIDATKAETTTQVKMDNETAETDQEKPADVSGLKEDQSKEVPVVSSTIVSDQQQPSVLSSLLRSPTHKSPTLSLDTLPEQPTQEDVLLSSTPVVTTTSNEAIPPQTAANEPIIDMLPQGPNKQVYAEETIAEQRPTMVDQEMVPDETTETEQITVEKLIEIVDDTVSEDHNVEENSSDTQPAAISTDKDMKKEESDYSQDKLDAKTSSETKYREENVNENRSESSKRKRFSSVNSGPGPTRRSGRFKPTRTADDNKQSESFLSTSGHSNMAATDGHLSDTGSAIVSGTSQSASQDGSTLISGNKVTDLNENANMSSGTPTASAIASALMEDKKGSSTHSEETNDSIVSDTETLGRGGPPSRALSISESIPNSPASAISDDPEVMKEYKAWKKSILLLWRQAATHKYSSLFTYPVTDDEAKGYSEVVYRPIDLTMIRKRIENGHIRTTAEFQHDILKMFQNAIMYNNVKHEVHQMAVEMQKEILESIDDFIETQSSVSTSSSTPASFYTAVLVTTPTTPVPSSIGLASASTGSISGTTTTPLTGLNSGIESRLRDQQPEMTSGLSSRRKSRG